MRRQIELYVREGNNNTGDYARVDLFDFEDINYTTRVADIRDIGKVLTDFTHSFTVPASKSNNLIFKHYQNFDILDGFDARYKRDAIIKINGIDYRKGQVSLNKTNSQKGNLYSYSLTFYGKTVSLNQLFGEDELQSLYGAGTCLDDFNHDLDGDYVSKGFGEGYVYDESTGDLDRAFSGANYDYCFPFISADDYHYYDSADGPSPKDNGNLSRNIHPSSTYNASIEQYTGVRAFALKPAIKVKWLIKSIEQKYNINFDNSFFNDSSNDVFDELFLWLNRETGRIDEQVGETITQLDMNDFSYSSSTPTSLGDVLVNTDQVLPSGSGVGAIRYEINFTITPNNTDGLYSWSVKDGLNNDPKGGQNNVTGTQTVTAYFQGNDYMKPVIEIRTNGGISSASIGNVTLTKEEFQYDGNTGGPVIMGWEPLGVATYTPSTAAQNMTFSAGINIGRNLPKMKITTFLNTIFKMFNLTAYFEPLTDEIVVNTMDEFYAEGTSFDLSEYIDFGKQETQKALLYNKIDFEYKGNETFAVVAANNITGDEFGNERADHNSSAIDSPLAFDGNKDYKVELPLEKMMFERMTDQDDETIVTDVQWGWMANESANPIKGKPVFMYTSKLSGATQIKFSLVDGGSSVNKTQYIVPSNTLEVDDETTQSLHWGSEFSEYTGQEAANSLFETYYKNYISDIYHIQSRLIKVSAILPTNIILDLRPNDQIVINNRAYRINKWETNLTTGKSKFELINIVDNVIIQASGGEQSSGGGGTTDTTPPTASITSSDVTHLGSTTDSTVTFNITTSESTTNLTSSDISVGNGTVSNFTGSGTSYSFDFTATSDGTCSVQILAAKFTDAAGNNNTASSLFTYTKNAVASSNPTMTISSTTVTNGGSSGTSTHTFRFTASEATADFNSTDVTTNGLKGGMTLVSGTGNTVYEMNISAMGNITITIDVNAGKFTGISSGNTNDAATQFSWTKI